MEQVCSHWNGNGVPCTLQLLIVLMAPLGCLADATADWLLWDLVPKQSELDLHCQACETC